MDTQPSDSSEFVSGFTGGEMAAAPNVAPNAMTFDHRMNTPVPSGYIPAPSMPPGSIMGPAPMPYGIPAGSYPYATQAGIGMETSMMPAQLPCVTPVSNAISTESKNPEKKLDWSEHKAPDGRVYYYNSITKQSLWEKPDELKDEAELLLSHCPWKEYKSESGKLYYHNVNTKESSWTIPKELEELKTRIAADHAKNQIKNAIVNISSTDDSKLGSDVNSVGNASLTPPRTPNGPTVSSLDQAMVATLANIPTKSNMPSHNEIMNASPVNHVHSTDTKIVFKDKKEAIEAFKDFLREKDIPSNSTWEQAVKIMEKDRRYANFKHLNEKKQAFNLYKTQKQKEEKEEQRLRAKKAKEDLEEFLMTSDRMNSTLRYYRCHDMFSNLEVWINVNENDRRDIYDDVVFNLAKREKEEAKNKKKKNIRELTEILDTMTNIDYRTTWVQAQQLLLNNHKFINNPDLLAMDKEDALIVFEDHIRELEKEEEDDREREKRRRKRQERKNRDNFSALLDELHEQGKLTSMSLWVELYPIISTDIRFSAMLGQKGSTPLDLFKFYVEDLKSRFHDERKIIKEILKEKNFDVEISTTFEQFATVVCEDTRSATLDAGNVKLTYNALLEKAESREKERQREEARKQKKLDLAFLECLQDLNIDHNLEWEEAREKIQEENAFTAITSEADRFRLFKEYQHMMEEACLHVHRSRKSKKNKKVKKRSYSTSGSDSDHRKKNNKAKKKNKRKSRSASESSLSDHHHSKSKHKKEKKKKKNKSPSPGNEEKYKDSSERRKSSDEEKEVEENEQSSSEKSKKTEMVKDVAVIPPPRNVNEESNASNEDDENLKELNKERNRKSIDLSDEELERKRRALLQQLHREESEKTSTNRLSDSNEAVYPKNRNTTATTSNNIPSAKTVNKTKSNAPSEVKGTKEGTSTVTTKLRKPISHWNEKLSRTSSTIKANSDRDKQKNKPNTTIKDAAVVIPSPHQNSQVAASLNTVQNEHQEIEAGAKNININVENEDSDINFEYYDYEDDFEDYESTFESYSASSDSPTLHQYEEEVDDYNPKKIFDEEKKLDSGSYDLTIHKRYQNGANQLDAIKEALHKENTIFRQNNSSSDIPLRDENYTEYGNDTAMNHFNNMTRRHNNVKVSAIMKARAKKFFQMITLDEMSYVFYDIQPVPYELFMLSYLRKNVKQAFTQTNEDNSSSDTQTDEIGQCNKWTQNPVKISKELLNTCNLNYLHIISGSGDDNGDEYNNLNVTFVGAATTQKISNFVRTFGEEMIAVLEENLQVGQDHLHDDMDKDSNCTSISRLVGSIKYSMIEWLIDRPALSVKYDCKNSSRLLTIHRIPDNSRCCYISLWSMHQPRRPTIILKSYVQVTCASFVSTNSSLVVAGHDDGSLSVWNIRDRQRYRYESFGPEEVLFLSPSYTTAQVLKDNHKSKVIQIDAIKMTPGKLIDQTNERESQMIYSLEVENILRTWTVSENVGCNSDIGLAPWSKIKFFLNQIIDLQSVQPKSFFQSTAMVLLSEHYVLIGTNAAFVIGCSLVGNRFTKYSQHTSLTGKNNNVTWVTNIEVCPYNDNYFLVAHSNAELLLFNIKFTAPVSKINCNLSQTIDSFITAQWLWNEVDYVLILTPPSRLEIFKLVSDEFILVKRTNFKDYIKSALVSPCTTNKQRPLHFILFKEDEIQIHSLL